MKCLAIGLLCLAAASGQLVPSPTSARSGPDGWTVQLGAGPPFGVMSRTGAPYSAVEQFESVQTLADGSTIRRTFPDVRMWRDAAGRIRTERPVFRVPIGQGPQNQPSIIEILDVPGRLRYVLDPGKSIAHRQEMAEWNGGPVNARGMSGAVVAPGGISVSGGMAGGGGGAAELPARPDTKTEQLPAQLIEGVTAEGSRQTMTWPAGSQGNDQPLVVVNESWMSRELGMPVLTKTIDPRSGEHTRKLMRISQSEPDAGLFQPPPGWTVVEEKGEFTILFPRTVH